MNKGFCCLLLVVCALQSCHKHSNDVLPVAALATDKVSITFSDTAISVDSFTISSHIRWNVSTDAMSGNWLHLSTAGGEGNEKIYVTVSKNNTADARRGVIIITADITEEAIQPVVLQVTQKKDDAVDAIRNVYGGPGADGFAGVVKLGDGTFIAVGNAAQQGGDVEKTGIWMVKTDPTGKILWQKTLPGTGKVSVVMAVHSRSFLVVANTAATDNVPGGYGMSDAWVAKVGLDGEVIWQKTFGGILNDKLYAAYEAADGYVLAGSKEINNRLGNKYQDGWVVRLDVDGNLVWERTLGGTGEDILYGIAGGQEGEYVLCGQSTSSDDGGVTRNNGDYDGWIVKLIEGGDVVWESAYGEEMADNFQAIFPSANGGYVVAGAKAGRGWIAKVGEDGLLVWQTTPANKGEGQLNCIIGTAYGYTAGGSASGLDSGKGGTDGWVVTVDDNGNVGTQKLLGGSGMDSIAAIIPNETEYSLTLLGTTASNDKEVIGAHGDYDAWMMKFDLK